jgi:hypothetical protein
MATGSGIPQQTGIQTSEITPSYSIPHDNAIAEALGNAGDAAQGVINGLVEKHYAQKGADAGAKAATAQATANDSAAVAAARPESDSAQQAAAQDKATADAAAHYASLPVITDVGKARQAAFQGSYLANIKTDIDTHIDATEQANTLNPSGFKDAADPIVAGYAKGAPPQFAVAVQDYAKQRAAAAFNKLSFAKTSHDQVTAVSDLNARQQSLTDDLASMAAAGQDATPEFQAKQAEWNANNAQKVANPLFEFGPNMAAEAASKQQETLQGAVLTHHATAAYNEAGGGEAGKQAAEAMLKREALDDGGALSNVPPDKRLKLYGVALANVRDLDKADAEQRQIDAEKLRQQHADQRDMAGQLLWGLRDGTATAKDVRDAEHNHLIEPGAGGHLLASAEAMARRDAADARMATAAERTANYGAMDRMSADGLLTPKYLAEHGSSLTGPQYAALKGSLDKKAKPAIDNITSFAGAAFHDNGITGASAKLAIQNLHADAYTWALNNPNSTTGQQHAFAQQWVKASKGVVVSTDTSPVSTAVQTRAQHDAKMRLIYTAHPPTKGDLDRFWAAYKSNHPTAK